MAFGLIDQLVGKPEVMLSKEIILYHQLGIYLLQSSNSFNIVITFGQHSLLKAFCNTGQAHLLISICSIELLLLKGRKTHMAEHTLGRGIPV